MTAWIYVLTNARNGTLYIGVTSDLPRRMYEHREGLYEGFSKTHALKRLVHVETFDRIDTAIAREKTLKKWQRAWKIALIEKNNPEWEDLYNHLN